MPVSGTFRRSLCVVTCSLAAALLGSAVVAQTKPSPAGASAKPAPIVTITKSDGATVRGNLESSDPDQVTVRPMAAAGGGRGEPIVVPWKEIVRVSNGLTRAKALEQWKGENLGKLCGDCRGNRATRCGDCKGVAHDPAASKDCRTCKGEMLVACKAKTCDAGKADCPDPCLKFSVGTWTTDANGFRTRWWAVKGGKQGVTQNHLGELITVSGLNQIDNKGKCPRCGGTTKVECATCLGTAQVPCATCRASKTATDCAKCEAGDVECATCKGSGLKA